jgi:chromosome segregation ATPase
MAKTQKLMIDLEEAHLEIERLESEMESMASDLKQKVESLEVLVSQKQDKIIQTEANVTTIGEYVDKLEERLAGVALGRRDIDNRERKCAEIEEKAQYMDKECIALREQITDNDEEHEELKALLEGMATDRTTLQGQPNCKVDCGKRARKQRSHKSARLYRITPGPDWQSSSRTATSTVNATTAAATANF